MTIDITKFPAAAQARSNLLRLAEALSQRAIVRSAALACVRSDRRAVYEALAHWPLYDGPLLPDLDKHTPLAAANFVLSEIDPVAADTLRAWADCIESWIEATRSEAAPRKEPTAAVKDAPREVESAWLLPDTTPQTEGYRIAMMSWGKWITDGEAQALAARIDSAIASAAAPDAAIIAELREDLGQCRLERAEAVRQRDEARRATDEALAALDGERQDYRDLVADLDKFVKRVGGA